MKLSSLPTIWTNVRVGLANGIYFLAILAIVLTVSTLGLARRTNNFYLGESVVNLEVQKDEVAITPTVSGQIIELTVANGQRVRKGDLIARIEDKTVTAKLEALKSVERENLSARTEAIILRSQGDQNDIYSSVDGIVSAVNVVVGEFVNKGDAIAQVFAENNTKLVAEVGASTYLTLEKQRQLDVYSLRMEQVYPVVLAGVTKGLSKDQEGFYQMEYTFQQTDDSVEFVNGELIQIMPYRSGGEAYRPAEIIANLWNQLLLGRVNARDNDTTLSQKNI